MNTFSARNTHFGDGQWADFVRGTASPLDASAMQQHLDSGCPDCQASVRWLQQVVQSAAADSNLQVPPELTMGAVALFDRATADTGWTRRLKQIRAVLILDQPLEWQPAGVRAVSAPSSGRKQSYRAGDYTVDLTLEYPTDVAGEVVGQLGNTSSGSAEGVLVQCIQSGRPVGETTTNRFGEFILNFPARKRSTLRLVFRDQERRIDLPLEGNRRQLEVGGV
ncbi:MAG: hypothetical protein NTV70_17120 [Acidobacteria bacterium]|nr:hypothetical protein [Acidobacteriota bacterium]